MSSQPVTFGVLAAVRALTGRNSDTVRASQRFRPYRSPDQSHALARDGTDYVS